MPHRFAPGSRHGPRSFRFDTLAARTAFLAFLGGCTSTETIERFKAKHRDFVRDATYLPLVSLTGSTLPEGRIHKEEGELAFDQVFLDALVPVPRGDDDFLIVGALAGVRAVDFDGVPGLADDDLHRYGVRLGYGRFLHDDLLVQGYWQPSLYSDLDGSAESRDYRLYYGALMAVYRSSPEWFWKLGVNANDASDTCLIPLAGFAWHFHERWSLQMLVPRDATLVYANDPWMVTTGLLLESDEYHVRSPESLGLEQDVHVQEMLAHVTVERSLFHGMGFLLRGGSTVGGDWDWGYGSGTPELTGTLEPDVFVTAGITYRF
jgi:hypothetical protein